MKIKTIFLVLVNDLTEKVLAGILHIYCSGVSALGFFINNDLIMPFCFRPRQLFATHSFLSIHSRYFHLCYVRTYVVCTSIANEICYKTRNLLRQVKFSTIESTVPCWTLWSFGLWSNIIKYTVCRKGQWQARGYGPITHFFAREMSFTRPLCFNRWTLDRLL